MLCRDFELQRSYATGECRFHAQPGLHGEIHENRIERSPCSRNRRPAEWLPSETVSSRRATGVSQYNVQRLRETSHYFGPSRVMRYTKKECYVQAITSPYFAARNKNRYSTKTIVESRVALREKVDQNGQIKPSKEHPRPVRLRHGIENFIGYDRQRKNSMQYDRSMQERTDRFDGNPHAKQWEPPIKKETLNRQVVPVDPFDFTYCI